jgi:hypothetical protein
MPENVLDSSRVRFRIFRSYFSVLGSGLTYLFEKPPVMKVIGFTGTSGYLLLPRAELIGVTISYF